MGKLEFKINEIPKGKSDVSLSLNQDDLDLSGYRFRDIELRVQFERREAVISAGFSFSGEAELICDRSLEPFWSPVSGSYTVLFKESSEFESEDDEMAVRGLDISGNIINIETEVRDTVMLSVPVRKIHPKFFDDSGELKEFTHEGANADQMDPRWEALRALKENTGNN